MGGELTCDGRSADDVIDAAVTALADFKIHSQAQMLR